MNKTYDMEDIMSLFYRRFFLESETIITKKEREKLIEDFQEYIEKKKAQKEQLTESFKNQGNEDAIKELDSYDDLSSLTEEQKLYMHPYRIFDFVPLETMLRDIKCDGVYERKLNAQGLNKTYIDLTNNREVLGTELINRGGKYAIITSVMEQGLVNFTITSKGETLNATFKFTPKLQLFCQPTTEVLRINLTRLIDDKYLVCEHSVNDKTFPFVPDSVTVSESNKRVLINESIYTKSINNSYFSRKTIDEIFSNLSVSVPSTSIIIPSETTYTKLNPIEKVAYFAMLQNSSNSELQEYFSKTLEDMSYNYATLSNAINPLKEANFKKYCPTASEITKYRDFERKEYISYMTELENKDEKTTEVVEPNSNYQEMQSQRETSFLPNNSETRTAKQILESSELLKQVQNVGITLSPEQEQIIYIGDKLQSEEFKEFQAKRSERLQKQHELRDKIQKENKAKEDWQNNPENPSNLSRSRLETWKKELKALEQVYAIKPSLLTDEQIKYISEIKETIEMYEQEQNRNHESDTGMSEESQNWYQEHYTGMRR